MARGPFWRCTDLAVIRRNIDKTDAEIAAMLPGRKPKAIEDARAHYGIIKPRDYRRDERGCFAPRGAV